MHWALSLFALNNSPPCIWHFPMTRLRLGSIALGCRDRPKDHRCLLGNRLEDQFQSRSAGPRFAFPKHDGRRRGSRLDRQPEEWGEKDLVKVVREPWNRTSQARKIGSWSCARPLIHSLTPRYSIRLLAPLRSLAYSIAPELVGKRSFDIPISKSSKSK